jgi:hypothetical protein
MDLEETEARNDWLAKASSNLTDRLPFTTPAEDISD